VPDATNSKLSKNAIDDLALEQMVIYWNTYGEIWLKVWVVYIRF